MIPAYAVREAYQRLTGLTDVGYVYIRGSRKDGGHRELITGVEHLPLQRADGSPAAWLVIGDMVNFAETPVNSLLLLLRQLGCEASQAAAVLSVGHPQTARSLDDNGVQLTTLTTVSRLLDVAETDGAVTASAAASYREYLQDPVRWEQTRGFAGG